MKNEQNNQTIDIQSFTLLQLQPSQFYVSEEKIARIESWFRADDLRGFEPIPVYMLDGEPVMLDGHTRAVVALRHGLKKVPLMWEPEEWDWEMYRRCVTACKKRGIRSPQDLLPRVISAAEYAIKWDQWCDRMQAQIEMERRGGGWSSR